MTRTFLRRGGRQKADRAALAPRPSVHRNRVPGQIAERRIRRQEEPRRLWQPRLGLSRCLGKHRVSPRQLKQRRRAVAHITSVGLDKLVDVTGDCKCIEPVAPNQIERQPGVFCGDVHQGLVGTKTGLDFGQGRRGALDARVRGHRFRETSELAELDRREGVLFTPLPSPCLRERPIHVVPLSVQIVPMGRRRHRADPFGGLRRDLDIAMRGRRVASPLVRCQRPRGDEAAAIGQTAFLQ
jgi:hypothetical protein